MQFISEEKHGNEILMPEKEPTLDQGQSSLQEIHGQHGDTYVLIIFNVRAIDIGQCVCCK